MVALDNYSTRLANAVVTYREQNARELLKKLIVQRFDGLSALHAGIIERADLATLDRAMVRVLTAHTPDEVLLGS